MKLTAEEAEKQKAEESNASNDIYEQEDSTASNDTDTHETTTKDPSSYAGEVKTNDSEEVEDEERDQDCCTTEGDADEAGPASAGAADKSETEVGV